METLIWCFLLHIALWWRESKLWKPFYFVPIEAIQAKKGYCILDDWSCSSIYLMLYKVVCFGYFFYLLNRIELKHFYILMICLDLIAFRNLLNRRFKNTRISVIMWLFSGFSDDPLLLPRKEMRHHCPFS